MCKSLYIFWKFSIQLFVLCFTVSCSSNFNHVKNSIMSLWTQIRAALDYILREVTRVGYRVESATFEPECCYSKQVDCPYKFLVLVFDVESSN